jgi:hypothetical protein
MFNSRSPTIVLQAGISIIILSLLILIRIYSGVLFHTVTEFISIVIAFGIFLLVFPTRRLITNDYLLFLGFVYFTVGSIDFLHTIGYKGVGILQPADANQATQLWIIARYIEAVCLLASPVFLKRELPRGPALLISLTVIILAVYTVFISKIFPDCFIAGSGLTNFKIVSEYIISAIVITAIIILWKHRKAMDLQMFRYMLLSMIFTITAEMSFTFYTDVFDIFNVTGHIFKIISFYCIYKALIENGLTNPLNILFSDLKKQEENLTAKNQMLLEEISNREKTESDLKQITHDLNIANARVRESLEELKRDKNHLVVELSSSVLMKSDIARENARMIADLRECNYEKEIIRKQLEDYIKVVEQSQDFISDIIE